VTVVRTGAATAVAAGRVPTRQRGADAALHSTAMLLMIAGMAWPAVWTPVLLAGLWCAQAVGAVLLRGGWRVHGAFVDLIAVSASLAVPFAVGHGHEGGSTAMALAVIAAVWMLARWRVGVRGRMEWVGLVTMGMSMIAMVGLHWW
jgi:hypothetical protein